MSDTIKPCPFCGCTDARPLADANQGDKWGALRCHGCGVSGPEVRTGYDASDEAPWHTHAIEEWNRRPGEAAAGEEAEAQDARLVEERDRLKHVGCQMANVMFNLAQGETLSARHREIMDKLRREWDAELRRLVGGSTEENSP